jgi:predicted transcriptional regulator
MSTLTVRVASPAKMKSRGPTAFQAKGPLRDAPRGWFPSADSFGRVLTSKNQALLSEIASSHPQSLAELANRTGRKKSNLSRILRMMERYGFVRLTRGPRGSVIPEVSYDEIVLRVPIGDRSI